MNQKISPRTIAGAFVVAISLAATASAQTPTPAGPTRSEVPMQIDAGRGLLGQSYVKLGYTYDDVHDSPADIQELRFEYNQPIETGFDVNLGYTGGRSSLFEGQRLTRQSIDANAVAFVPGLTWGKPYVSAGAGWLWTKNAGVKGNSFLYQFETGVEWQATGALSLRPFVQYVDAPSVHLSDHWHYGVKANYWFSGAWGVNASLSLDNKVDAGYGAGVTYRF